MRRIRQRLVDFIKRWPALYRLVSRVYYTLQVEHLTELLVGTRVREKRWAARTIGAGYWANRDHPSKPFLMERIAVFAPFQSILEVGCASGPNLYLLAKRFPKAQIVGVDINREAVEYGNEQFAREGISHVKLVAGRAGGLGEFQDGSFDIVFTNALLIYIGPDKIREVVPDLLRIARRALILIELHRFTPGKKDPSGLGVYEAGNWVRDYVALLKNFVHEDKIRMTKIPEDVWPVSPWKESGAVIEVIL